MSHVEPLIKVVNVVASVTLGQNIDLLSVVKVLPETVEYKPDEFPGLIFKLKTPKTATLIFSSGKMVCTGAKSEELARAAVMHVVDELKRSGIRILGEPEVYIQNIVASVDLRGKIDLERSSFILERTMYEPEMFPGLIYRMDSPKVAILIFSSGKLVCAGARKEESIVEAVVKLRARLEQENLISYEY